MVMPIDDQPISATLFGESKWLSEFITPKSLEIQELFARITQKVPNKVDRLAALGAWVSDEVHYVEFVKARMWVEGQLSEQSDMWNEPSITARVKVGNCTNKSFLLASLVRNELPDDAVYCVLGNLHNGEVGGHAWVQVNLNGADYIMETTVPNGPPLVLASLAQRYEPVHLFNDRKGYVIEGRTVMQPFSACYSTWLKEYLNWAYIEGGGR